METNPYLIPANSKKSQLILGFFNPLDLTIFLFGVGITVMLLLLIKTQNIMALLGLASPALVAVFLVMPVPNYHNVRTLIGNIYRFFTGRKKYYWRGWCASYDSERPKRSDGSNF